MDPGIEDSELLRRLASALGGDAPHAEVLMPLQPRERALLLRIARDVAHASERQNAPLAAYMIGRFAEAAVATGLSEPEALARAAAAVQTLIGEGPA